MRTATTLAKTHGGQWLMTSTPDVSIVDQKNLFRSLSVNRNHAEYAELHYQESDGEKKVLWFKPQVSAETKNQKRK